MNIVKIKYYQTVTGRSPIEEFLSPLSTGVKEDYFDAEDRLAHGENLTIPLSKPLPNIHKNLHELRFKDTAGIYRFFYFIKKKDAIYFLHAVKKKTQKITAKEKKIILKRIKEI